MFTALYLGRDCLLPSLGTESSDYFKDYYRLLQIVNQDQVKETLNQRNLILLFMLFMYYSIYP